MLRDPSLGNFSREELNLLRKQQPFLEFALNSVYLPRRIQERNSIAEKYGLTPRELDVLEHLVAGANNKTIANELNLGLPTVKTHIQHIYQKTTVSSRTELLSNVLSTPR